MDFFVGPTSGLILLCRLAATIGTGFALWVSVKRDYPERDQTPGRAFIFSTLLTVSTISLIHEAGLIGAETYGDLIVPAAALVYIAHALGAFLYVRAANFRHRYLRPNALATSIVADRQESEEVINLDE